MAKFDLFNPASWAHIVSPNQQTIKNKLMGALGNKIGEISALKRTIVYELEKNNAFNDVEYDTALTLNEEETRLMNVVIHYPDDEVNKIIQSCDKIQKIWNDKNNIELNMNQLINELKVIEPHIAQGRRDPYIAEKIKETINLTKIRVTGNSLWSKLIEIKKQAVYWQNKHNELLANTLEACSYYDLSAELKKRPGHDFDY